MSANISFPIEAGRGTKLYKNGDNELRIEFVVAQKPIQNVLPQTLFILGKTITSPEHFSIAVSNEKMVLRVPPHTEYMFMNTSQTPLTLYFSEDPSKHEVIYDPYLYENEEHQNVDPDAFKQGREIPEGYVDTLPKWYSVKYTYPDYNLIFVKPGLGISIQKHKMREEHWEVVEGSPIIIADTKVYYNTKKGDKFVIPIGALHTVINPTQDWICIKETYKGTFDEMDITRVFNPNNYH